MAEAIRDGDKSVTWAALDKQWEAIQNMERSLIPAASRKKHGVIHFRRS